MQNPEAQCIVIIGEQIVARVKAITKENPLSYATEVIIEIKQFNPGRMASHSFIENNRRFMVFPLRDHFIIENGL